MKEVVFISNEIKFFNVLLGQKPQHCLELIYFPFLTLHELINGSHIHIKQTHTSIKISGTKFKPFSELFPEPDYFQTINTMRKLQIYCFKEMDYTI
jgi:hypothetical protein